MIAPEAELKAIKVGKWAGVVAMAWALAFFFFRSEFSPTVFWALLISVAALIIGVPSWLSGRRAKREHLENQDPSA